MDILAANAGSGIFRPAGEKSVADWRRTIDIKLSGAFRCSRNAIQAMRGNGGGFIVHLSRLEGKNLFADGAAYNASRIGVNGMSEAMILD